MMKLYSYWRSSTAYRVRIALNLKSLKAEIIPVNLLKGGHKDPGYMAVNPQGRVPTLDIDGSTILSQSMAILEYLEEQHPTPPLLPDNALQRAYVRQICNIISNDIHPLNNLSVLKYLTGEMGVSEDNKARWYHHWITSGFHDLETIITRANFKGRFCCGDNPTFADCALIPQIYNARRFNVDLSAFPTLQAIEAQCATLQPFIDAAPENQPDATP